jgi:hypothetical protein
VLRSHAAAVCSCPPIQQVNYFNAKPEHVRDNRYLAARIDIEDLLATEPEVVTQRRERLREVLLKVRMPAHGSYP